jgi:DNA-directed RNA polymerase subunit RPC12/RpoP
MTSVILDNFLEESMIKDDAYKCYECGTKVPEHLVACWNCGEILDENIRKLIKI